MISATEARALLTVGSRVTALVKVCEDEINRVASFKQECRIIFRKHSQVDQHLVIAGAIDFLQVMGFDVSIEEHEVWINDQKTGRKDIELVISWKELS